MKKIIITSSKFPVSGPYSAAVEVNGIIFISGQLPIDPATGEIINDIKTATRQVLTNIQTILEEAGLDMSNVVKTTIFLKNIADFSVVNEIYASFFRKILRHARPLKQVLYPKECRWRSKRSH